MIKVRKIREGSMEEGVGDVAPEIIFVNFEVTRFKGIIKAKPIINKIRKNDGDNAETKKGKFFGRFFEFKEEKERTGDSWEPRESGEPQKEARKKWRREFF